MMWIIRLLLVLPFVLARRRIDRHEAQKTAPAAARTLGPRVPACTASATITNQGIATSGTAIVASGAQGTITVTASGACATATVLGQNLAVIEDGAVVTLLGNAAGESASALISGGGTIAYASNGFVNNYAVTGLTSVSMQTLLSGYYAFFPNGGEYSATADTVGVGAVLYYNNPSAGVVTSLLSGAIFGVEATQTSNPVSATVTSASSVTFLYASGAGASLTILTAQDNTIGAVTSAWISVSGSRDNIYVDKGGTLTANEYSAQVTVTNGGTAYITGEANTVATWAGFGSIGGSGAIATILSGTVTVDSFATACASSGVFLTVQGQATGTVGAGARAVASSQGSLVVQRGGTGTVGSSGTGTAEAGGYITVQSGGLGVVQPAGTAFAGPGAALEVQGGATATVGPSANGTASGGGILTVLSGGTGFASSGGTALASGGASVIAQNGGTGIVEAAATGLANEGGVVSLSSGGVASVSSGGTIVVGGGASATASDGAVLTVQGGATGFVGPGGTASASPGGLLTVQSGGTGTVGSFATAYASSGAVLTLGPTATATVGPGADVQASSGAVLYIQSGGTGSVAGASSTYAFAFASLGAYVVAQNGGFGEVMSGATGLIESGGVLAVLSGGTATVESAGTAFSSSGAVLIVQTGGVITVRETPSNLVTLPTIHFVGAVAPTILAVPSGGTGTVSLGGIATASSGAFLVVQSGAGSVGLASGATASMSVGAIITAPPLPAVSLIAGPGAAIVSIGDPPNRKRDQGSATYSAASTSYVSGGHRRALPRQTQAVCAFGSTYCPGQMLGSYVCTNTSSDIFNCGGCAASGGVDCTTLTDIGVECIEGRCIEQSNEYDGDWTLSSVRRVP